MKHLFLSILIASALTACNCSSKKEISTLNDVAGKWIIQSIDDKDRSEAAAFIAFADDKLSANAGCNTMIGDAEFEKETSTIKLGMLASSRKMCPDISFERELSSLLTNSSWKLELDKDATKLWLSNSEHNIILNKE